MLSKTSGVKATLKLVGMAIELDNSIKDFL
jgi:hypothetical protein